GEDAFKLYDTFGFPIDLTKEIVEEKGITVDEEKFNALMLEQRQRARNARKDAGADAWKGTGDVAKDLAKTNFVGYTELENNAKVIAVISNGELKDEINADEQGVIVLDTTSFYAESGGQVGDVGIIEGDGFTFEVDNTTKTSGGVFLHQGTVLDGTVKVNAKASARVDKATRFATMRNHTAAHLLQAALRSVLGTHVEQAGQLVNSKEVRFDFSHFSALTSEEIAKVENIVNSQILSAIPVTMTEMPIEEAKKLGAMALFGEKYGDVVRVVEAKGCSVEFCGGTHVDNTSKLGLFKIITEASVASGVRRIQGVTGEGVIEYINHNSKILAESASIVKATNVDDLPRRVSQITADLKNAEKEKSELSAKLNAIEAGNLLSSGKDINGVKVITSALENVMPNDLRSMCDEAKSSDEAVVLVLASAIKEKGNISFAVACSKSAIEKGAHAGNIVREVAKLADGSGGGKPDSAMAGGKDITKLQTALDGVEGIVASIIK
ncbi:MAG: alanine--tRNA ligase, partial [Clostridiales bacterium]|nr:alanine--tRNA ligase [Clostridiales bacterium]